MWWQIYLDFFRNKIGMFHISCVTSLLSVIVSVPDLEVHCSFALVFVSNFYQYFRKVLILHALSCVQNKSYTSGLQQLHTYIYCEKCEYEFCKYYVLLLVVFFFQKRSYKVCQRITLPKSNWIAKFKWQCLKT